MTDVGMAGGTVSVTEGADGTLQIYPSSSNYRGVVSVAAYDMTGGGEVTVKAKRGSNNAQCYMGLCVGDYSSEWARICSVGSSIEVNSGVANTWGSVSGEQSGWAVTLGNWAWWRIKENAGDLDFYTSPDGSTWTFRVSYTTPTWDLAATHVSLEGGQWGAGGEVINRFDDLNPAAIGEFTGSGGLTLGAPALSGAGAVEGAPVTGEGALTITAPSLAGSGTNASPVTGTGAPTIGAPAIAGSGTVEVLGIDGTGGLLIRKPRLVAGERILFLNKNQPGISDDINNPSGNFGYNSIVVDPADDTIVYFGTNRQGIWKSTDAGDTWAWISTGAGPVGEGTGSPNTGANWALSMDYFNGAIYTSSGHNAHGVWKSTDGGVNWVDKLDNAKAIATDLDTRDVYTIDCDPWLEDHLICTFHYYWEGGASGIIESYDGGDTWTKIEPEAAWGHNNMAWFGNDSNTVMIGMQDSGGVWITRNHFVDWTQITTTSMTHGAVTALTRAPDNTLLIALSSGSVLRSEDDGDTWENIGANLTNSYDSVATDGTDMWTCPINTGDDPLMTKPLHAAAATNWTYYQDHPENPANGERNGPVHAAYSPSTGRVYTVNWRAGLFIRDAGAPAAPEVEGSGGVQIGKPALAATGTQAFTATAALLIDNPALAAAALETFTGTGALAISRPTLAGSGLEAYTGTGSLSIAPPSLSGFGATGDVVAGAATLLIGAPALAAAGQLVFSGTGTLLIARPAIDALALETFSGVGGLLIGRPSLASFGASGDVIAGAATLLIGAPSIASSGSSQAGFSGTGGLVVRAPALLAAGLLTFSGTGTVLIARPTLSASGLLLLNIAGTATILIGRPSINGAEVPPGPGLVQGGAQLHGALVLSGSQVHGSVRAGRQLVGSLRGGPSQR